MMKIGHLPIKVDLNNMIIIAYEFVFKVKIL